MIDPAARLRPAPRPTLNGSRRRAESSAASDRIREIINGGALSLALSIGHRAGLWDVLARVPAMTSRELAEEADLSERYVREWLGAVVTGGIVTYDPEGSLYSLPRAFAKVLTRRASPDNLAVASQFIPLVAGVEDEILDCFRHGGGLPYRRYRRFHEVMAEMSSQTVVSALHDRILPLVPQLARRLERGIEVLDVGCGQGRAMVSLASAFPNSRFRGIDISRPAIKVGRSTVKKVGLHNLRFSTADAARLNAAARYDLITAFDSIHDQAEPAKVLSAIRRALRDGGVFLMQDIASETRLEDNIGRPWAPFFYTVSYNHCMSVSLAHGGAGLGTCWGRDRALTMLREAGFTRVRRHELAHDVLNDFYVAEA